MRKSKMSIAVLLALALTMGLAASSWAGPGHGGGWGCGPGAMNLNPEQAGKLFDLKQKFNNDTAQLRRQMWVKRAELRTLWNTATPDEKAIVAAQKEVNALRGQLQEKRVAFRLALRKIAPQLGQGFGRGRYGCPYGYGPGGGHGPGGGPGPGGPAK